MTLSVPQTVIASIANRYEIGKVDRRTYHNRQSIADAAMDELGETVPDTAIGAELINAWLSRHLDREGVYV